MILKPLLETPVEWQHGVRRHPNLRTLTNDLSTH